MRSTQRTAQMERQERSFYRNIDSNTAQLPQLFPVAQSHTKDHPSTVAKIDFDTDYVFNSDEYFSNTGKKDSRHHAFPAISCEMNELSTITNLRESLLDNFTFDQDKNVSQTLSAT